MLAPASNANSERVFSSLRRVKTYLRSTMTQTQLENLMKLAIHKEIFDETDLIQATNTFVKPDSGVGSVRRLVNFGEFTIADRKQLYKLLLYIGFFKNILKVKSHSKVSLLSHLYQPPFPHLFLFLRFLIVSFQTSRVIFVLKKKVFQPFCRNFFAKLQTHPD